MTDDKMKSTLAEIRLRNEKVGVLTKERDKSFLFKYDGQYLAKKEAIAISISFPLEGKEFKSQQLHPFFDNLIMEGWLLNQTEKKFHIDKKNRWGLLMLAGANPIGAVSIHALDDTGELISDDMELLEEGTTPFSLEIPSHMGICSFCLYPIKEPNKYHLTCYKKLWGTAKALFVKLDKDQPLQSFSQTVYGGSISGAQRKGLFTLKKNQLTVDSANSNYILKPDGDHPELPANEHLTMTAARHLKFNVPPTGLIKIDDIGLVFVIKRFDRVSPNYKLLVEDMAQIYEEASDDKYSLSYEKVGQAISQYTQAGPLNLNDYFRRVLFCYLTANGDMHLKNWSLLEMKKNPGIYTLSPAYDWLNTRIVLSKERDDMAIPLMGKKSNMQKSYFKRFALDELKLNENQMEKVFAEIPAWTKMFEDLIPRSFLSEKMKKAYLDILKQRSAVLR